MDIVIEELNDNIAIEELLQAYDEAFQPSISSRLNVKEYAIKLAKNAKVFIAKNEEVLGFVALYANDHETKIAYIAFIGIAENARNQKIGTRLLNHSIRISEQNKMEKIMLEVQKNNKTAQSFYRKNGFIYLKDKSDKSILMVKKIK